MSENFYYTLVLNFPLQLSLASSEVPSRVSAAVQQVEQTSDQISQLSDELSSLIKESAAPLRDGENIISSLDDDLAKILTLGRTKAYLGWLRAVEDVRYVHTFHSNIYHTRALVLKITHFKIAVVNLNQAYTNELMLGAWYSSRNCGRCTKKYMALSVLTLLPSSEKLFFSGIQF